MNKIVLNGFAVAVFALQSYSVKAEVVPNSLFSEHAVLQRNMPVPVWGTARNGEKVTVEFAGQKAETVAADGRWIVKLKPLKAGGPFVMTIKGDNAVTINDILVGEVWVCSGQSNMAFKMATRVTNGVQEIADAKYPQIRQYYVPNKAGQQITDIGSKWIVCSPETITGFTAVGYFFARDLYKKLNIPFGIILSAVGGTPVENWTSREALSSSPEFKNIVSSYENGVSTYPMRLEKYKNEEAAILEKYKLDTATARKEGKPLPNKPSAPQDPAKGGGAGGLYAAMIKPLQPFAIKGTIWYQGEANSGRGKAYQTLFPMMIADWRKAWGQGDFPFYFVQIAPHKGMSPEIREAQFLTAQKVPNTAMAVTIDCGNAEDIHPVFKQPVGARLALAARALAYNEKIEYSGPVYQSMQVDNSKAVLTFSHAKNLVAKGGELKGFQIAGTDKKFVDAKTEIKGNKLVVYSPDVAAPTAVRYGWTNVPDVNLYNEVDIPASPFRTDL
ncbi:sialate O-acetylesterase [Pedobacter sp. MC2016-14]|uniref:sialate O-acetylesterase n=1 Tax=Pedobacter sp. MC2016-14 TaxID=2897327 RepID=UPI001E57E8C1|nr:sialate O-acetylesterase [Pedobacter sp. MC2016-14]MCD0490334.1 sialate O-acetylesterase [Pedobacter sp. MC2016-14]